MLNVDIRTHVVSFWYRLYKLFSERITFQTMKNVKNVIF